MKVLRFYPDTPSAHVAKSLLASHDIDTFVADENLANIDPPVVFATGGVRLMIADELVDAAKAILDRHKDDFALPDDWEPPAVEPTG